METAQADITVVWVALLSRFLLPQMFSICPWFIEQEGSKPEN
jgi:hypothetical protein